MQIHIVQFRDVKGDDAVRAVGEELFTQEVKQSAAGLVTRQVGERISPRTDIRMLGPTIVDWQVPVYLAVFLPDVGDLQVRVTGIGSLLTQAVRELLPTLSPSEVQVRMNLAARIPVPSGGA